MSRSTMINTNIQTSKSVESERIFVSGYVFVDPMKFESTTLMQVPLPNVVTSFYDSRTAGLHYRNGTEKKSILFILVFVYLIYLIIAWELNLYRLHSFFNVN